jgi:hypothetical protein
LFGRLSDIIDMSEVLFFVRVENIISALFITFFYKEPGWRMELVERRPSVFCIFLGEPGG